MAKTHTQTRRFSFGPLTLQEGTKLKINSPSGIIVATLLDVDIPMSAVHVHTPDRSPRRRTISPAAVYAVRVDKNWRVVQPSWKLEPPLYPHNNGEYYEKL